MLGGPRTTRRMKPDRRLRDFSHAKEIHMTVRHASRKGQTWYLYVIRTVGGALYAGITTDVRRRYQEHAAGGPKAARFLRAHPPQELVLKRSVRSRCLALMVEYRFKQLPKRTKEAIVEAGKLSFDRMTGQIRR